MTRALPHTVDVARARELLESTPNTRVIDVRSPGEFEAAHIPGSHNVPLDLLRSHRADLATTHEDPVLLVCGTGSRAEQARALLAESGPGIPAVLDGGITAWQRHDAPVTRGAEKWEMERQVRLVAGSIVLTSVLGSVVLPKLKWIAAGIGGGLTFAALTNTCGMAFLLAKLPHNRAPQADAPGLLPALTAQRQSNA